MEKDLIKMNATRIWNRLETNLTDTNLTTLREDFNFSEPELSAALGWLENEDKITFVHYNKVKATYVFPKE